MEQLRALVSAQPDLTLAELRHALGVGCSLTAVWRAHLSRAGRPILREHTHQSVPGRTLVLHRGRSPGGGVAPGTVVTPVGTLVVQLAERCRLWRGEAEYAWCGRKTPPCPQRAGR